MVSWVQPDLVAMTETDGHGDTCGPIVIADYLHVVQGMALTVAQIDALRAQYIAAGLMDTPQYAGMTITSIAAALEKFHNVKPLKIVPWGQFNLAVYHSDLIAAMEARQAIVHETGWQGSAGALPGNQSGVVNHFILAWGIDSANGYYCCNGDTLIALSQGGTIGPVWYSWGNLLASGPGAYLILPAIVVPPPPPPPTPRVPFTINGLTVQVEHAALTYS